MTSMTRSQILTDLEVKNNINTYHGISLEEQQDLRTNNCYYLIDLSQQFPDHISKATVSAAMMIVNYFFIHKAYCEYDRHLMCTAALFFSSKLSNEHRRVDHFVVAYYKLCNKLKGIEISPPLQSDEKEVLVDLIIQAELRIVKLMFTNGHIIGNDMPYKYVNDYIRSMFVEKDHFIMFQYALTYVNDTFFTTIPLVYGCKEIALACVMISSQQLGIPINAIDEAKWYRTVGTKYCEFDAVLEIVPLISSFYTSQVDKVSKDENKPDCNNDALMSVEKSQEIRKPQPEIPCATPEQLAELSKDI